MRCFLAFLLLTATCQAATFTAWVSESWKANTTNWTVQIVGSNGILVGKDITATANDHGVGSGANVIGNVDVATAPDQWVTAVFFDTDTPDFAAAIVSFYIDATGNIVEPTYQIGADTTEILADTNEMQQDQAAGGRLDLVWQGTKTDTTAILADTDTLKTTTTNIYADTQALQPLISGVNVTTIQGGVARAELDKIWDALLVNHQVIGSFGEFVQGLNLTPSDIADSVWDALSADHGDTGSFGKLVNDIWSAVSGINLQFDYAAPDNIANARTLFIVGSQSSSIAEINRFTSGVVTLACNCDNTATLNPGTTISTIVSATVASDADSSLVATSDLRVQQNKRAVNFSVDPITSSGWYTCTVTVVTSDGQTLAFTGKLQVR